MEPAEARRRLFPPRDGRLRRHLARRRRGFPHHWRHDPWEKRFPADTPATIAAHFAYYINEVFVGVWAEASGGVLTITVRSPAPAYSFSFSESDNSAGGTVEVSGALTGGIVGEWVIDDAITPVLNRATRDWHADYFAELAAFGMSCVVAFSQELVLPPDNPPLAVWVQRFPDGRPVETATGFGNLHSSHCAFAPPFRDYIKQALPGDGRPDGGRRPHGAPSVRRGALVVLPQRLRHGLL